MIKNFFIFIFVFCLSLLSGLYFYYLYKYPKFQNRKDLLEWYTEKIFFKTGGYLPNPEERIQHFLNFPPLKEKGVIRIGTFGDSYTYGAEVEKNGTYPYFLQQLFNKGFPGRKIEVLNFGVSGHGFQEQFFLWEEYSKKYSLDYILLGPACFQPDRDLTFGNSTGERPLLGVKNRFILSKRNTLKEVSLKGSNGKKRLRKYYQFVPSLTAFFYDKRPFETLEQILFPFLKNKIPNPFYYKKMSMEDEAVKISTLLLKKIKDFYNKKILFFTYRDDLFNQYKSNSGIYNLNLIPFEENNILYRTFDHTSSFGNEFIAKIFFNALIGKKNFYVTVLRCNFNEGFFNKAMIENFDFHKVESIQVTDGQNILSTLRHNSSDHYYNEGTYKKHKTKEIKSFISFSPLISGAPFFSISRRLKEKMKVYIQSENGYRIELGSVKAIDSYKRFFVLPQSIYHIHVNGIDKTYTHHFSYFVLNGNTFHSRHHKIKNRFRVYIEDLEIGMLYKIKDPSLLFFSFEQQDNIFKFIPNHGYGKSFLMVGSVNSEEKNFSDEFPIHLQYKIKNGKSLTSSVPWRCRKEGERVHLNLPNFNSIRF